MVCVWRGAERLVQSVRRPSGVPASALVLDVLDRLGAWTLVDDLAEAVDLPVEALVVLLDGLQAHDLIEQHDASGVEPLPSGLRGPWASWSPAAHLFHLATRDVTFARRASEAGAASSRPDASDRPPVVLPVTDQRRVALPAPDLGHAGLVEALRNRRTHRRFGGDGIDVPSLATLLGVTFGVQAWAHAEEGPLALKTSPSGGARHSLEAYVRVREVGGVPAGIYHYRGDDHVLVRLGDEPDDRAITRWLPAQTGYEGASAVVVVASVLARVAWRYRSARAYRVVLIETCHLAQTFCLAATALGLAPFCTAALADSVVEADLGLDGLEQPVIYAMGVGSAAAGAWRPHDDRPDNCEI